MSRRPPWRERHSTTMHRLHDLLRSARAYAAGDGVTGIGDVCRAAIDYSESVRDLSRQNGDG